MERILQILTRRERHNRKNNRPGKQINRTNPGRGQDYNTRYNQSDRISKERKVFTSRPNEMTQALSDKAIEHLKEI